MLCGFLTFLAAYAASSFALQRYPYFIHKKKKLPFQTVHVSHRGGAGERTENTLDAFRHAVSLGTNMLELDCHLTKDKEVVIFHDSDLLRTTGIEGRVKDFNFSELPNYMTNLEVQFSPGYYCDRSAHPACSIPRLRDLFETLPDVPVNIDIKVDDDVLIRKVADLIREYRREHLTIWGSGKWSVTQKCKKIHPDVPTFTPMSYALFISICYCVGLLPFIPIPFDVMEIPMLTIFRQPEFSKPRKLDGILPQTFFRIVEQIITSPNFIKHLRSRGIPVIFWVCNTETHIHKAFNYGASGVMTDYPSLLSKFLKSHSEFPKPL